MDLLKFLTLSYFDNSSTSKVNKDFQRNIFS